MGPALFGLAVAPDELSTDLWLGILAAENCACGFWQEKVPGIKAFAIVVGLQGRLRFLSIALPCAFDWLTVASRLLQQACADNLCHDSRTG